MGAVEIGDDNEIGSGADTIPGIGIATGAAKATGIWAIGATVGIVAGAGKAVGAAGVGLAAAIACIDLTCSSERRGNVNLKTLPFPGFDSTHRRP